MSASTFPVVGARRTACGNYPTLRTSFSFDRVAAMDYAMAVRFNRSRSQTNARLALLGAMLVCGVGAAWAGELIIFSGRVGPASPQDFDRREPLLPAEVRSGARAIPSADLQLGSFLLTPQTMTPTTGLTRRQAELLDQRRNWLMQSPDAILKQATDREDTKSSDPRDEREAPKSATERFLEGSDAKTDPEQKLKQGESPQKQSRDRNATNSRGNESRDARNSPEDSTSAKNGDSKTGLETRATGTARGSEGNNFFSTAESRGGGMGRVFNEARERDRQRERDASLDTFKRNFNNPWAQPVTAGGGSALTTGGGLSATMGLPSGDSRRPASIGGLNMGGGRPTTDLGPRGGLGDFDAKGALNSGGPQSLLQNNEPPRVAPKPIVLEIPKRKF